MQMSTRLLSLAIATVLAVPFSATAGRFDASPAAQRALGLINAAPSAVRHNAGDSFVAKDVIVDANGTEHVRFDRTFRGMPVIGGDVVVHSRNGIIKSTSMTLGTSARPGINGRVSADQAILAAGTEFGTGFNAVSNAKKVVFARNMSPRLAYEVVFSGIRADQTPTEMHYFVDANSGQILDRWDGIETGKPGSGGGGTTCTGTAAAGTGNTLYSGSVVISTSNCGSSFEMKDLTRGGGYTTDMANGTRGSGTLFTDANNIWGNGVNSDRATAAADAHFGIATTFDYYKNILGRDGIANDGKGALSKVHYGRNYVNAYWSDGCFCMTFGDGDGVTYGPLVNLDVAGHEMSHGVTSRTANLTYSGESGGLNESNSDIFGTMVEFYAHTANDPGDYEIGEELYLSPGPNKAFRFMYNPALEGANRSVNCWYSGVGSLDVHYSSGPSNHYFYLLAEGSAPKTWPNGTYGSPTCNGTTVTGIGRDAAAKIQYRALTVYMNSSTNYAGARAASLKAAADLYGGVGSTTYNAVGAAWAAVNVN